MNSLLMIIRQFLGMATTSFLSFLVDYLLFIFLGIFGMAVGLSYAIARILSAVLNYNLNCKAVFKSTRKGAFIKYYILAVFIMLVGSFGTQFLVTQWGVNSVLCKFFIDLPLFFFNFLMQRHFIF